MVAHPAVTVSVAIPPAGSIARSRQRAATAARSMKAGPRGMKSVRHIAAVSAVAVVALVVVPAVGSAPASAQTGAPWWTNKSPKPRESDGAVVLTLRFPRAGRVRYKTFDGTCTQDPLSKASRDNRPCEPQARAPEDYAAVDGEVVFTSSGFKDIRIPIVNDDLAETTEAFTIEAWEEPNGDWPLYRSDVIVRITDDETAGTETAPAAVAATTTTAATSGRSSSSAVGSPRPTTGTATAPAIADHASTPTTPTTATTAPPTADLQVALPNGEFRPQSSPELTSEEPAKPEGDRGGSTSVWVFGVGAAILAALALAPRRRRSSPTPLTADERGQDLITEEVV